MKKMIAFLLAAILVLGCTACGSNNTDADTAGTGDEIKQGASLIVREGQTAVFIYKGQIADIFSPGSYNLDRKLQ